MLFVQMGTTQGTGAHRQGHKTRGMRIPSIAKWAPCATVPGGYIFGLEELIMRNRGHGDGLPCCRFGEMECPASHTEACIALEVTDTTVTCRRGSDC